MAVENRSNAAGAINAPPSNSDTYTSRGVFNNTGTSAGVTGTSGSSTSQTTLNPSTGGGTGGNANDTTITLSAGVGLTGGGDFTTNQADAETITFDLGNAGAGAATYTFDATNVLSSLQVDVHGRVLNVTGSTVTPVNPFNDNLRTTASFAGGAVPAPNTVGGVETDTPVSARITVDASDYTIDGVMPTGTNVENLMTTIDPDNDGSRNIAEVTGTIPANTAGNVAIRTTTTVRQTSTTMTEEQDSTPLSTTLFVPYYTLGPVTDDFDFSSAVDISSWTPSTAPLEAGAMNRIMYTFTPDMVGTQHQIYWAIERVPGRNYVVSVGTFEFPFTEGDTLSSGTRLGRSFDVYKFYSGNDQTITITF